MGGKALMRFTAPGIPAGKGRPRVTRRGHAFTPAKTMAYEGLIAHYALRGTGRIELPFDRPLRAEIVAVFQRPASRKKAAHMDRKPDLDNIVKSVLDGLSNAGIIRNDSRVVEIHARKEYGDMPETRVRLTDLIEPATMGEDE